GFPEEPSAPIIEVHNQLPLEPPPRNTPLPSELRKPTPAPPFGRNQTTELPLSPLTANLPAARDQSEPPVASPPAGPPRKRPILPFVVIGVAAVAGIAVGVWRLYLTKASAQQAVAKVASG